MILIIDSGSTKADWVFSGKSMISLGSAGMNPCFIDKDKIVSIIRETLPNEIPSSSINKIFFYGAGTSGDEQKKIVRDAFTSVFRQAEVVVEIDTMAAVRATCGNEAGIACIIGTGSNSILFDGQSAKPNNYGLGFILADEGAGTYLGKKLITHYLYGLLPKDLSGKFAEKYSLTRTEAISNCYSNPNANSWLASYSKFLFENKSHSWVKNIVAGGFDEFIHLYVMNYPGFEKLPVHFVGSVAFLYQEILIDVLKANNLNVGKIIQKPIDGLIRYHADIMK